MQNNNIENRDINKSGRRPVKQYGMPACGRGKLVNGNTYQPPVKKKVNNSQDKEQHESVVFRSVENTNDTTEKLVEVNEVSVAPVEDCREKAVCLSNDKKSFSVKTVGKWFAGGAKGVFNTVTAAESPVTRSVRAGEKGDKFPISKIVLVGLLVVLLMFVVIDYVKIFENNQMISELKNELEYYTEQEKKLTNELNEQYDVVDIGEYASNELGMVSGENQQKVYVDVSEDEIIEGYDVPTQDYGAIATIMNALGQSAKAWIEVFGG